VMKAQNSADSSRRTSEPLRRSRDANSPGPKDAGCVELIAEREARDARVELAGTDDAVSSAAEGTGCSGVSPDTEQGVRNESARSAVVALNCSHGISPWDRGGRPRPPTANRRSHSSFGILTSFLVTEKGRRGRRGDRVGGRYAHICSAMHVAGSM